MSSKPASPASHLLPRLLLASSNASKLREYRALAGDAAVGVDLSLLPNFSDIPEFEETAPTFAENAAGKALYYSRMASSLGGDVEQTPVFADDSGLCVTALGGRPGVHSARYAGPNASNAERIAKLLEELRASGSTDRSAQFVCVIAVAVRGRILAVVSDSVTGEILDAPRGAAGFGYDPIFFSPHFGKTFAEIPQEQKNLYSHRGKAFRTLLHFLTSTPVL